MAKNMRKWPCGPVKVYPMKIVSGLFSDEFSFYVDPKFRTQNRINNCSNWYACFKRLFFSTADLLHVARDRFRVIDDSFHSAVIETLETPLEWIHTDNLASAAMRNERLSTRAALTLCVTLWNRMSGKSSISKSSAHIIEMCLCQAMSIFTESFQKRQIAQHSMNNAKKEVPQNQ